jgi:hypothetical protein
VRPTIDRRWSQPESSGLLARRLQVVLCYGLRRQLQAALLPDDSHAAAVQNTAEHAATALEPQILRLLLELDVPDDATRGRASRTR